MAARPAAADMLFVPLQLVERREERPRLAIRHAQNAAAATRGGLESEDRFDALHPCARHLARRRAVRVDLEAAWLRARGVRREFGGQSWRAADSGDAPCERQHVAPMTF